MIKRILLVLSLTFAAALAMAQQDFYHRPGFLAGRTVLTLALFEEVQTELKTPADFKQKSEALLGKMQGEIQELFQNAGGDFSSIRPAIEKVNAKYDDETFKLLTAEQVKRIKELFIQFNGAAAVPHPAIAKDLGITEDQKTKIKAAQDDNGRKLMESFGSGGSPEEARKTIEKLQNDLKAEIEKLLTEEQKTKFKEMQGAKFEFKKVAPNP